MAEIKHDGYGYDEIMRGANWSKEYTDREIQKMTDALDRHKKANPLDHPASSIASTHLKNSAVTEEKLGTNAVTTNKIMNNAVTDSKIGNRTVSDPNYTSSTCSMSLTSLFNRFASAIRNHKINTQNPHNVTKAQVGLGNVDNLQQATKAEFNSHKTNRANPHSVTKSQVGLGSVDNLQQATKTEFNSHKNAAVLDHPDGSVTEKKIKDKAVTFEKLSPGVQAAIDRPFQFRDIGHGDLNDYFDTLTQTGTYLIRNIYAWDETENFYNYTYIISGIQDNPDTWDYYQIRMDFNGVSYRGHEDGAWSEWKKYVSEAQFEKHQKNAVLDHPDASVTDNKIGERSVEAPDVDAGKITMKLTPLLNRITDVFRSMRAQMASMKGLGKTWNAIITHSLPRRANKSQNVDFDNLAYHLNKTSVSNDENENQWMHGATTKPTESKIAARNTQGAIEAKMSGNIENFQIQADGTISGTTSSDLGKPKAVANKPNDYLPNGKKSSGGYGMNVVNLSNMMRHRHYQVLDHPDGSVTKEKLSLDVQERFDRVSMTGFAAMDLQQWKAGGYPDDVFQGNIINLDNGNGTLNQILLTSEKEVKGTDLGVAVYGQISQKQINTLQNASPDDIFTITMTYEYIDDLDPESKVSLFYNDCVYYSTMKFKEFTPMEKLYFKVTLAHADLIDDTHSGKIEFLDNRTAQRKERIFIREKNGESAYTPWIEVTKGEKNQPKAVFWKGKAGELGFDGIMNTRLEVKADSMISVQALLEGETGKKVVELKAAVKAGENPYLIGQPTVSTIAAEEGTEAWTLAMQISGGKIVLLATAPADVQCNVKGTITEF